MSARSLRAGKYVDYNRMHHGTLDNAIEAEGNEDSEVLVTYQQVDQQVDQAKTVTSTPATGFVKQTMDVLDKSICGDLASELEALEIEETSLRLRLAIAGKRKEVGSLRVSLQKSDCDSLHMGYQPPNHPLPPDLQEILPTHQSAAITTSSLAKDKELNAALDVLKNCHLDFLDSSPPAQPTNNPGATDRGKSKCLLIPDFVTKPTASLGHKEDRELVKGVVLRAKLKPNAEEVSTPQWITANARILLRLIDDGLDMAAIKRYLRYTAKVGDYLQVSETSSVMLLDNDHRSQVFEEDRAWDNIDGDKRFFYLEKNRPAGLPISKPKPRNKQATDSAGKTICFKYNSPGGCQLTYCKFSHTCIVPGCSGEHSKQQHPSGDTPPRFRNP